jgi:hypothetical protein
MLDRLRQDAASPRGGSTDTTPGGDSPVGLRLTVGMRRAAVQSGLDRKRVNAVSVRVSGQASRAVGAGGVARPVKPRSIACTPCRS